MIRWTKVIKWGTIAGAFSAIVLAGSQIWGMADASGYRPIIKLEFEADNGYENEIFADLKRQIGLVVDKMTLIEWELLYAKVQTQGLGSLTFQERQKLCLLTKQLGWSIPECP